jgi:hypothetical protein
MSQSEITAGIKAREIIIEWYQSVSDPIQLSTEQIDTLVVLVSKALQDRP